MALVSMQAGALDTRMPFPDDCWYKRRVWELEDGKTVTLSRRGDDFCYIIRGGPWEIATNLSREENSDRMEDYY